MIKAVFNKGAYPVANDFVRKILNISGRLENKIKGTVEINIIGDREMKKMNNEWRKKNKTTDVLSFAWNEEKKINSRMLGQIFISYPQVKRQAKESDVPLRQEFSRILAHGLLHLVGYDHLKPAAAKKMFSLQEKIVHPVKSSRSEGRRGGI